MTAGVTLLIFFILLACAIPIGVAMGIITAVSGSVDPGFAADSAYVIRSMLDGIDGSTLLAVPMFVLSGIIMAKGGISRRLFDLFIYIFGKRTAGIPCAVIATCLFYGAISGSAPATVIAVGGMAIPMLAHLGYDKVFVVALIAVSSSLAVIIPPSIPFVLLGASTGVSVGHLFTAGILPGLLVAVFLMLYAIVYCKINGEDRDTIHFTVKALRDQGFEKVLKGSVWALLTPVIILGCICGGVATPAEASVISVYYALVVSVFFYKTLAPKDIWGILIESVKTYGPILFLLAAAAAFSRVIVLLEVPVLMGNWVLTHGVNKLVLLFIVNVVLFLVGMLMDTSPAILILAPVLSPIVAQVGVDPVHFGVIMVVNLAIGFVTPPVGINLFVAKSMSGLPIMTIAKKAAPMILLFGAALLLIIFIPAISLAFVG